MRCRKRFSLDETIDGDSQERSDEEAEQAESDRCHEGQPLLFR